MLLGPSDTRHTRSLTGREARARPTSPEGPREHMNLNDALFDER